MVCAPQALALPAGANPAQWILAGNVFHVSVDTVDRLPLRALPCVEAWPTADALLSLAPAQLAQGLAVAAQDALPIYVRDKVAQTVAERTVAGAVR
jgi:tRNA threonylcarbamoyladenosine biosynthesis protein TsaB